MTTLSIKVIQRFMTASEFEVFMTKYMETRHSEGHFGHKRKDATEEDRQIFADYKGGMITKKLMLKYGLRSVAKINAALLRAARE